MVSRTTGRSARDTCGDGVHFKGEVDLEPPLRSDHAPSGNNPPRREGLNP
jgi:hypothetical protein